MSARSAPPAAPARVAPAAPKRRRPAPAVDGERPDRRRAILAAAERLFARRGYHAVSIRDIAEEAGVPSALIGYHFGPKEELFHALFAQWRGTVDARLAALREAQQRPPRVRLRAIMQAYIGPVLRLRASPDGEHQALLVARELFSRSPEAERALREHFDPMALAFIDALQSALPQASRSQLAWCYQFSLGALLHHLGDDRVERLSRGANRRSDPAAEPLLLAFIVGGIRAVVASEVASLPPRRGRAQRMR